MGSIGKEIYDKYDAKLQGRNRESRKLGNNTYLVRYLNEFIAVRLHNTYILKFFPDGKTQVNTGGWKTVTTKARLSEHMPREFGYSIWSDKGVWFWFGNREKIAPFTDGDMIDQDGVLTPQQALGEETKIRDLRLKISRYAKACSQAVPLNLPGPGDCWYCLLEKTRKEEAENRPPVPVDILPKPRENKALVIQAQSMGESFGDLEHLKSHMQESYIVPSLVLRALEERKATDYVKALAFDQRGASESMLEVGRREVLRAVRKYMFKQFGLAR
jgi:hypothetical protein